MNCGKLFLWKTMAVIIIIISSFTKNPYHIEIQCECYANDTYLNYLLFNSLNFNLLNLFLYIFDEFAFFYRSILRRCVGVGGNYQNLHKNNILMLANVCTRSWNNRGIKSRKTFKPLYESYYNLGDGGVEWHMFHLLLTYILLPFFNRLSPTPTRI